MRNTTMGPRLASLLFLAVSFAAAGCRKPSPETKEEPAPVPVRLGAVELRKLRPSFHIIGTVLADPERLATLTAAAPGFVDRLAVREGARVAKAELVIQLDERKARTDVERAEAALVRLIAKPRPEELVQAKGLVAKAQSGLDLMLARLRKTEALRARSPDLVPEVQLLEDRRNEQTARTELETARAQLSLLERGPREVQRREARVEVEAAALQLKFCRVVAPLAGEVIDLKARIGQRADVGVLLATILDTSEVVVQARVPGNRLDVLAHALKANSGPHAVVRSPSFPAEVFPVVSAWLSEQTETTTGDVPLKLRVPNAAGLLRVGMAVQVEVFGAEVEGLAIPEIAFTVNEEGKHVVTLVRGGKAVPTEIELTAEGMPEVRAAGWIRVVKGLKLGDVVAVENGYALPEGTAVVEMPPKEPSSP